MALSKHQEAYEKLQYMTTLPSVETDWFCNMCQKKYRQVKKDHDYLYHDMKNAAYMCNCGYGTLFQEDLKFHVLKKHNLDLKYLQNGSKGFWWTKLPAYNRLFYCRYCQLKTPFHSLKISHSCQDFARAGEMPNTPLWHELKGEGFRPFCETKPLPVKDQEQPDKQPTKPDSEDDKATRKEFTINRKELENRGVLKIPKGSYQSYEHAIFRNDAVQRGALMGKGMSYAAIVVTDTALQCGTFWITDIRGQVVAEACATIHYANMLGDTSSRSYFGYNPVKMAFNADMVNLDTKPFATTHHLSVSKFLPRGEYRMTRQDSSEVTMKLWFEDAASY